MRKILIAIPKGTKYIQLVMPEEVFQLWPTVKHESIEDMPNGTEFRAISFDDLIKT